MEKRIESQLERLNKQDEIRREFLAYVSHDLRTPLAGMKAYLETIELKQDDMSLSERQDFLQKAITNGDRLEGMINELFELTRLESQQIELNKEEFSIGDLLSDIVTSLEEKAKTVLSFSLYLIAFSTRFCITRSIFAMSATTCAWGSSQSIFRFTCATRALPKSAGKEAVAISTICSAIPISCILFLTCGHM